MTDDEFDDLFRTAYPRLVAMGLAMSTERHVAQDLAQETLLRAYRRREELAAYDAPMAWCRRVMGNLLIDQHRSRTAERTAVERLRARTGADTIPGTGSTDPAHAVASNRWSELVAPLSAQQRLAATLYYAEDQSVASIAETMEIATGTVKSALSKARDNIRRLVDPPSSIVDDEEASS